MTVQCTFSAASNAISDLMVNSFWSFNILNSTVDDKLKAEISGSFVSSNTTLSIETSAGNVSVVFIPGSSLTFDPVFPPELAGMYTCGVRNVSFADVDDVTLSITTGKRRGRGEEREKREREREGERSLTLQN